MLLTLDVDSGVAELLSLVSQFDKGFAGVGEEELLRVPDGLILAAGTTHGESEVTGSEFGASHLGY